jgi:hypothetical protein
MATILRTTELGKYIDFLIRDDKCSDDVKENVCETDLYNYVLEYGKSNIIRLNYMLKDVDRALFDGFCDSVHNSEYSCPCDENGVEVEPEKIEPENLYTIEEHLEYVKQHPYFQVCNEKEQEDLIHYVRDCHEDLIIERYRVFFEYNFQYKYVQQFRDIIFNEIERLKQQLDNTNYYTKIPKFELPNDLLNKLQKAGFIENAANMPLKWLKSNSLLAYFVDVANSKLNLKHGQKRLIKPFETMFNVSGLAGCINEYKNKTGQYPQGYKEIDSLFVNRLN